MTTQAEFYEQMVERRVATQTEYLRLRLSLVQDKLIQAKAELKEFHKQANRRISDRMKGAKDGDGVGPNGKIDRDNLVPVLKIDVQSGEGAHQWQVIQASDTKALAEIIETELGECEPDEFGLCIVGSCMTREQFENLEEFGGW